MNIKLTTLCIRIILVTLFLSPALLYAQFNDSTYYYTGFMASGTINNTNSSSSFITNEALKLFVKKKDISLNSTTTWIYGYQQKALTNNDINSSLDFNLYKTFPHFYYWGLANYASSFSLKINNQLQSGAGAAYNIIDKESALLNISDGILYENSDIYRSDSIRDIYSTFRNSLRLKFRWKIKDIAVFNGSTFYQNSFSSGSDYIIRSNLDLNIKLYKWLSITSAFAYNRFNRTGKENTLFTYGLSIDRYF